MKNKLFLFFLPVFLILASCQKELAENDLPAYCNITSISVKDGAGGIIAVYQFTYDSVRRRPTVLSYEDFDLGTTNTVFPTYINDTISLGLNSYLVLDASKRIKLLSEANAPQGLINGDYYYNYNINGQMNERLIDDGVNNALRTDFTYANGSLTAFTDDIPGYPQSVSGTLTYNNSPTMNGYSQYQLVELFPELLLYMPLIQMGKMPTVPINQLKADITIPGNPTASLTSDYKNYTFTSEGWLSSFETSTTIPGTPTPVVTKYEFQYRCFN